MTSSGAQIREIAARTYRVPTDAPEADGTLAWSDTTVVIVTAQAADVVGLGWTYAHQACVPLVDTVLRSAVVGADLLDIPRAWQSMQRAIRNHGRLGLVSCAMSAVDIALWDAAARWLGLPLCRLLGRAHDTVPVYGSGGFTSYDSEQLARQIEHWVSEHGMPAVKIKIGESWGTATERDLNRVEQALRMAGSGIDVYVDANGAYSVGEAGRVGQRLDELHVAWFAEPVSSDDRAGLRTVRESVVANVAAGEYGYDLPYFDAMLAAGAIDCCQIDLTHCGGFGEWHRRRRSPRRPTWRSRGTARRIWPHTRRWHAQRAPPGVVPRPRADRAAAVRRCPRTERRGRATGPVRARARHDAQGTGRAGIPDRVTAREV